MTAAYRKMAVQSALGITLALILVGLASVFLLVAVGLGIWHGELRTDLESRQNAVQLNRAGNITLALFFGLEAGAAWLLMKSTPMLVPRLHWMIKFFSLLIGIAICSSMLVRLSLAWMAPDPIFDLERILSDWLVRIAA